MADAYTTTTTAGLDQAAYDLRAYYALRPQLYFDDVATVRQAPGDLPGTTVVFRFITEMAEATTPLSEAVDVDAVALADTTTTLTLAEYGNAVTRTRFLAETSYIPFDPIVANVIGYNAGVSIDTVAGNVLKAGTNVIYATGGADTPTARNQVDTDDTITAHDVRHAVALLRGRNVSPIGGSYVGYIHPDVSIDLREDATAGSGWTDPVNYNAAERRWNGDVGKFEGVRWIENPRGFKFTNASDGAGGTGNIDVYRTVIVGQDALAKGFAKGVGPTPIVRPGPTIDKLMRFRTMGWYWIGGYLIFRQDAIQAIESTSTIATNTA